MTPKQVADFLRKQAALIELFPDELDAMAHESRPMLQPPQSSLEDHPRVKRTGDYYATLLANGDGLEVEYHFHSFKRE